MYGRTVAVDGLGRYVVAGTFSTTGSAHQYIGRSFHIPRNAGYHIQQDQDDLTVVYGNLSEAVGVAIDWLRQNCRGRHAKQSPRRGRTLPSCG